MVKGKSLNNVIVHLSSFPPRECGIAHFTQDLIQAFDRQFNPVTKSKIVALEESSTSFYVYPQGKVLCKVAVDNLQEYVKAAEELNKRQEVKLVNIQHEFGLFEGNWGDYLIAFLQTIEKPVVMTLHSVIPHPEKDLFNLMKFIAEKTKVLVVMNELSKDILLTEYRLPAYKVVVIPHGIPAVSFESSKEYKQKLGLQNRIVLTTFGFLSPNKGIEYAISALPSVIKNFPNIIYLIVGETHPVVRAEEGENYRRFLRRRVEKLGLTNYVKFYNKYLSLNEIISYLKATDLYLSPSLAEEQSVSGTLSYALGCGRAVVSTATSYGRYLINNSNGILVEPKNSRALSKAIKYLLEDDRKLREMQRNAYEQTRKMTWPNVARRYYELYKKIAKLGREENKLPELKLDHLYRLTDNFGIIHHARYSKPQRRFGYSLDDNSRALIVASMYYAESPSHRLAELIRIYLRFLHFCQKKNGDFCRTASAARKKDRESDEDVLGRAIWALGYFLSCNFPSKEEFNFALHMFKKAVRRASKIESPRSMAFAMTGLYYYLKKFSRPSYERIFYRMSRKLLELYHHSAVADWHWFEDRLTYSNSKLPEALFYAYELSGKKEYLEVAKKSLNFLRSVTFEKNWYAPIGQAGWYIRNKKRSYFDQQPEDTSSMVQTKVVAYKITRDKSHLSDAYKAFQWFLGRNYLKMMVYDEATGGCYDGLGKYGMNLNQGAESTISYLLARLAIGKVISELDFHDALN